MKKIVYIRKDSKQVIQGVAPSGVQYLVVGHKTKNPGMHGGGFIGSMDYNEQGLVEIRKVDEKGQPVRNFGTVSVEGKFVQLLGDGAMVPAVQLDSIVFCDEAAEDVDKPAKPIQQQSKRP